MAQNTTTIEFKPNIQQYGVLTSKKKFILAMAGLQGGKTFTGCFWANNKIQEGEESLAKQRSEGQTGVFWHGLIIAPSYDQMTDSVLAKFFEIFPHYEQFWDRKGRKIIFPSGQIIFLRSVEEPRYIRGITANWVWVDEADYITKNAWTPIESRATKTGGQILFTSSWSEDSLIYTKYEQSPEDYDLFTWESRENPSFPVEEWERLKRTTDPDEFQREYGAKPIMGSGRVYTEILNYGIIEAVPSNVTPLIGFLGIDYGSYDPTAMGVLMYGSDLNWYIIDEVYETRLNIDQINLRANVLLKRNDFVKFAIVDPRGGIAKYSMKIGVPIMDGDSDIESGVFLVRNLIHQQRLFVLKGKCPNHIREFTHYGYVNGKPDTKRNNHAMDEVRYVIKTASKYADNMKPPDNTKELPAFWARKEESGVMKNGQIMDREYGFDNDGRKFDYYDVF